VGRYDGARNPAAPPPGRTADGVVRAAGATAATPAALSVGAPLVIVPGVPVSEPPVAGAAGTAANPPDASGQKSAPLFKGLFSDRSEPISQVVRDLWTPQAAPPGSPAAPSRAASLVSASGTRELFRPQATGASGLFGR